MWITQRHAIAFLKSGKYKSNFSQTIEWKKKILRRKTNKSYGKTTLRNDVGNNTKKIVNLIPKNPMPKAIIKVYFKLLVTNFYAQIYCSSHSKFVKITSILMHRIAITVFVYIRFPAPTKMFWLVTCPQNQDKNNGPAQFRTKAANSKSKRLF